MKILIAVDEHTFGDALADFVVKHEWPPESKFKVVHVIEPINLNHTADIGYLTFLESVAEESMKIGRALTRHVGLKIRDAFKTLNVTEEVVEGHPVDTILNVAQNWEADYIVLGSHGRHGLKRLVLGSVSTAVMSNAPCSVMIVRPPLTKGPVPKELETSQQQPVQPQKEYVK